MRSAALVLVVVLLACARPAAAQDEPLPFSGIGVTPIGALPPLGPPMPASRNHHYLHFRAQMGRRWVDGARLDAYAVGADIQWLGGSIAGLTIGEQRCTHAELECDSHRFVGARARISIFTTGPTIGRAFHDYSASLMVATEFGFGYAPNVLDRQDACSMDAAVPVALGFLQGVRVVPFLSPGFGWEMDCATRDTSTPHFLVGYGISFQQLFTRGLDLHIGGQKVFQTGGGSMFGVSISLVPLF